MDAEFRRDLQNSYLVLKVREETENRYTHRMITENKISGLLSCSCRKMNGDTLFYYDITSKISLAERCRCKKMTGDDFMILIRSLIHVLADMEEYLLDGNSLCLNMDYIYLDAPMKTVNFCWVPGEHWNLENTFRELMENLLPCIDHQNQEGVWIGYGFYQYAMRELLTLDGLRQQLEVYQKENKKDELPYKEEHVNEYERNRIQEELFQDEKDNNENHAQPILVTMGTVGIFLFGISGWYLWRNYSGYLWIWGSIGILSFIMVLAKISFDIQRRHKAESQEKQQKSEENQRPEKYQQKEKKQINLSEEVKGWKDENLTQLLNLAEEYNSYVLEEKYPDKNRRIQLKKGGVCFVGKLKDMADIVLTSSAVSRLHARIRIEGECVYLQDLNSKNGTWVNGREIQGEQEVKLNNGDEIRFADMVYILKRI